MRTIAAIWLLTATAASAQTAAVAPAPDPSASPSPQEDGRRFRRGAGGGLDVAPAPPDLSVDFDAFAPENTPPPRAPRFDPRRPSLAPDADPLAALIRNGPSGAALPASQAPEAWMLPGVRRVPTLADPPPGSTPATRPAIPRAPEG